MKRSWLPPLLVFAGVFLVYLASPIATPFDSRWTVHTALSLIHEHNLDLNEYAPLLQRDGYYAIECILPSGERRYPVTRPEDCTGGRLYNFYPVASPILAAPFVALLEGGLRVARPVLAPLAASSPPGFRRRLLEGDLVGGSMPAELILASALVAFAAVVVYLLGCRLATRRCALIAAMAFAFGTSAWSIGSRALWMHGFSMLLLPAGLWAALRARWALAGAIFTLAFFVRPTNVVALVFAVVWACYVGRRHLLRFAAGAAPVAAVFVAINFATYGIPLAPFFFIKRVANGSLGFHPRLGEALLGNLISPARGLFVFSPILLFSIHGLRLWARRDETRLLALFIAAVSLGHYLLMSTYDDWFAGHSFGPRYMSDLCSLLALALLPAVSSLRCLTAPLFMLAFAFSLFVHSQGAVCWPCIQWNTVPTNIGLSQHRLWDWTDPPFLRGFRSR